MPTVLTGNPANITSALSIVVHSATGNAVSPIVCTTATPHLFGDGDSVTVTGAAGNTAMNGTWYIAVISSTSFSLTSSTGNGVYTADSATATDTSLTPQFQVPSDGDSASMNASLYTALQALADRTQYLQSRMPAVGGYRLISITPVPSFTHGFATVTPGVAPASYSVATVPAGNVFSGDMFDISMSGIMQLVAGGTPFYPFTASPTLSVLVTEGGVGPSGIASAIPLTYVLNSSYLAGLPTTFSTYRTVSNPGAFEVSMLFNNFGSTDYYAAANAWTGTIKHWRPV